MCAILCVPVQSVMCAFCAPVMSPQWAVCAQRCLFIYTLCQKEWEGGKCVGPYVFDWRIRSPLHKQGSLSLSRARLSSHRKTNRIPWSTFMLHTQWPVTPPPASFPFVLFPFLQFDSSSFQSNWIVLFSALRPPLSSSLLLLFCSFVIFHPLLSAHLLCSAFLPLTRFCSSLFNSILFILYLYFPSYRLFSFGFAPLSHFLSSLLLPIMVAFVFHHACNIHGRPLKKHTHTRVKQTSLTQVWNKLF